MMAVEIVVKVSPVFAESYHEAKDKAFAEVASLCQITGVEFEKVSVLRNTDQSFMVVLS